MQEIHNVIRSKNDITDYLILKKYRVVRHTIFLLGFLLFQISSSIYNPIAESEKYYWNALIYIAFVSMFYINTYTMLPFLFKGKHLSYLMLLLFMIIAFISIIIMLHIFFFKKTNFLEFNLTKVISLLYGVLLCFVFILASSTLKLFQRWTIDNKRIQELQTSTLQMELSQLKNQINPHFLFNMLNNVKALIRKNPPDAVHAIMQLSDFLRHQLYENSNDKTSLSKEIVFLTNYLNLEQIRRDKMTIYFNNDVDYKRLNNIELPTHLFSIFVENAVKHSVDINEEPSYIDINISISNTHLHFNCFNSVCIDYIQNQSHTGGIGLVNIQRRLDLLYGNSYCLDINATERDYTVNLVLPI